MTQAIDQQFGESIRKQRKQLGWPQEQLAQAMSELGFPWHQTVVAKTEAAQRPAKLSEAYALASILGIDLPPR